MFKVMNLLTTLLIIMIICETKEDVYHCLGGVIYSDKWWEGWKKNCEENVENPFEIREHDLLNWGTLEMKMKYLKEHVPPKAVKLVPERLRKIINAKVAA